MLNKQKNLLKQSLLLLTFALLALPSAVHAKMLSFAMIIPMSAVDIHNFIFSKNAKNDNYFMGLTNMENIKLQEDLKKAKRIDAYFEKRDMPLAGHGLKFVNAADKYDIDWRLLAAIGVRESSGGKHLMNNNPFGWGGAKIKFADFDEAIEIVSMNLGGGNPNTAQYYQDADTKKKLWYYNGTVIPSYPAEVIDIMEII